MTRRDAIRLGTLALVCACASGAREEIMYGVDVCAFCKMQIAERQFAAELVTKRGRTIKFDSIECLRDYLHAPEAGAEAASLWVADFRNPSRMIHAEDARFVDIGPGRAPMGRRGWIAVASARDAAALGIIDSSAIKRWTELE